MFSYEILLLLTYLATVSGDCGAVPVVANGVADANPSLTVGSEVTYQCDVGYEFRTEGVDVYTIECQADGTWTDISDCDLVECPILPTDAVLSNQLNTYGETVTMSCALATERIPGVAVNTDLTVQCQANKTWDYWDSISLEGCIPISCPYPMADSTGSLGNNQDHVLPDGTTVAEFTCDTSFYFRDGDSVKQFKCDNEGFWKDTVDSLTDWSCIPDECSDLITTYNLQNVKLTPQTSFAGETIKIACMDGHEYNDSSIEKYSTCRANDTQWTYEPFDCLPKLCPPVYNISHCNISTTDNWYPTEVNFTCTDGYFFPDGSLSRLSMCNKYGRWSEVIPQCTDTLLSIETNFTSVVVDAKGAKLTGALTFTMFGLLIAVIIILDIITFPRQIGFFKRNLSDKCECLRDEEEEDLQSLDGDEVMRASSVSLGRGRITPAASTVDLQYGEKSRQSQLNTLDEVDIVNEELKNAELIQGRKNIIPRTRLMSAKTSIQRAMQTTTNINSFKRNLSAKQKNQFGSEALPLGQENYGKVIELRPPSPEKELPESDTESEYETDSEEEV